MSADSLQLCADIIVQSCATIFDAVFRTQSCNNHLVNDVREKSIDFDRQTHVDWPSKAKPLPSKLYEFAWGESNHSCMRIVPWAKNSGDSKMRHGHTRRGSRNKIPRASCLTLNSLRGTHRCHLFHVLIDMRAATSLERAPKPWLSTVTICHSGQSPPSGIILMGQR